MSTINKQFIGTPQNYTINSLGTTKPSVVNAAKKKSKLVPVGRICKPKPRPVRLVNDSE